MKDYNMPAFNQVLEHEWRVNIKGLLQIVYGVADHLEKVEHAGFGGDDDYKSIADAFAMCGVTILRCAELQARRDAPLETNDE